jgi:hypothetical protein
VLASSGSRRGNAGRARVQGEYILSTRHESNTRNVAKRELLSMKEILNDDLDDRTKCERVLDLIVGTQKQMS